MSKTKDHPVSLATASIPVLFLLAVILYGLLLRPYVFDQSKFPLEILFLSLINLGIAPLLAILGIGCFYNSETRD